MPHFLLLLKSYWAEVMCYGIGERSRVYKASKHVTTGSLAARARNYRDGTKCHACLGGFTC